MWELIDFKKVLKDIINNEINLDKVAIKIVELGDNFTEPYVEDLTEIEIGSIEYLLNRKSILCFKKVIDKD